MLDGGKKVDVGSAEGRLAEHAGLGIAHVITHDPQNVWGCGRDGRGPLGRGGPHLEEEPKEHGTPEHSFNSVPGSDQIRSGFQHL